MMATRLYGVRVGTLDDEQSGERRKVREKGGQNGHGSILRHPSIPSTISLQSSIAVCCSNQSALFSMASASVLRCSSSCSSLCSFSCLQYSTAQAPTPATRAGPDYDWKMA
jgi:hypothetical protein